MKSFFKNNELLFVRGSDSPLFGLEGGDGEIRPTFIRLDGYVIIPKEKYYALLSEKLSPNPPPDPSAKT